MKFTTTLCILFAFLAFIVDGIVCTNHEEYETTKIVSYSAFNETQHEKNQDSTTPLDHCAVSFHFCTKNLGMAADKSFVVLFFSHLFLKDQQFHYNPLKLNTFLSYNERPPTIS